MKRDLIYLTLIAALMAAAQAGLGVLMDMLR